MGWFDEQIRERMRRDQEVMEDSFVRLAGSVLGSQAAEKLQDERLVTKEALDEILRYYHMKPVQIPDEIRGFEDQLDYVLRPLGLMTRNVALREDWYRHAYGPMLGILRENNIPVALLPGKFFGYEYRDPASGNLVRINRSTAKLLSEEALCFYMPLPMKKLGIPDLMLYMKRCISRGDWILIILATFIVTQVGMLEPRAYQVITGPVLRSKNVSLLAGMSVFLLCAAFSNGLLSAVTSILTERISLKTSLAVEAAVMMRILSLPLSFFRHYSSGEISTRAGTMNSLCSMLLGYVMSTGLGSVMSLLYIGQIFRFTPALVVPSIIIIGVTTLISLLTSFLQIPVSRKKMKLAAENNGMSYAMITGIQKIRMSGAEKRSFARWAKLYSREAALDYNPPLFLKLNGVVTTAVSLIGTIVLYYMAVRSGVDTSEYFAFSAAYGRVMGAFASLAGIAISAASVPPLLEMVEPILKTEPEVTEKKEVLTHLSGSLEMSHVSFRYEENTPYVLKDFSLKIRAGEYVAIVGRTGCGKSTLIRLLLGFETPESGAVFYDGRDLAGIDPRSLRRRMGVVSQNGQLFQDNIFSNITISAPWLNMDAAWEAAEIAGIAQDIRDMPMGMHTIISEGQGGISGGQKQRILIARAIAPKPRILILDEATSALDNLTQKQVSEALDQLKCTRIVIAHRLSTIRNCDRILVMDQGRIIESGTYEELIAMNGEFADLVARQRLDTASTKSAATGPAGES
jgi:NHLM bacteriocin system ABC transporter ATP-binding protein